MNLVRTAALAVLTLLALAPTSAMADAGYKKGFFISGEDGDRSFGLTLNFLLQTQFNMTLFEQGDDTYAFELTRARVIFKGHLGTKDLTFKILPDFGKGSAFLIREYYTNYAVSEGFHVRVGQWKRPFSRHFINSSAAMSFVDRALTEKSFGSGFDLGLAIHNDYEKSPEFEWVLGVFNGPGDSPKVSGAVTVDDGKGTLTSLSTTNVPKQFYPVIAARVGYNYGPMKGEGYTEMDLNPEKGLRLGIGLAGQLDLGMNDDVGSILGGVDFILKVSGFTASGNFALRTLTGDESGLDQTGFRFEANYVINNMIAPMVRFARVMPDSDAKATTQELGFGCAVLFSGQQLKWVTDVSALGSELGDASTTDWRVRSQVQMSF